MKDFKEIVKKNKKRALSIAVATAFAVSGSLGFAGCYNPEKEDDEEQDNGYSGSSGYSGGWHGFVGGGSSSGTYSSGDSSGSGKSSITESSGGESSGYSGLKGGSSSS